MRMSSKRCVNGLPAFRRKACDRVLTEHGDEVFINRCARCGRIVARPTSKQCLWCGHDWHEKAC
jgi:hypothetical protein